MNYYLCDQCDLYKTSYCMNHEKCPRIRKKRKQINEEPIEN